MANNIRAFIVLLAFGLLSTHGRALAAVDTLSSLMTKQPGGDSAEHVNILRKFNWTISYRDKSGTIYQVESKKADTVFSSNVPDTVRFSGSFYVVPVLRNIMISLGYEVDGSVMVTLNGKKILETGDFQRDKRYRSHLLVQDNYADFIFNDSIQRMEVVYLPYPRAKIFHMKLRFEKRAVAEEFRQEKAKDISESYGVGFYYLAFGIVFLILYTFFREKTENLYFSLFCIFAALWCLWGNVQLPWHSRSDFFYNLDQFFGVFSFEFLSIFFCKILMNREKSKIPLLVITGVVALCFLPMIRYNYITLGSASAPWLLIFIYSVLYMYTWIATLYYLISGIGKKQWEARAVLIFCFVPIALFVLLIICLIVAAFITGNTTVESGSMFGKMLSYLSTVIVYVYPLAAVFILGRRNGMNQVKLIAQVDAIRRLSEENLAKEKEKQDLLESQKESLEREVAARTAEIIVQKDEIERQHTELKGEKQKSDDLLLNILPAEVAEELKQKGFSEAKLFDNVTVLFADFVDFTKAGEAMSPQALVNELHVCFKAFDEIISRYNIEKIKTIGDAYLAVCGLPIPDPQHAVNVVNAATEICQFMKRRQEEMGGSTFHVRVGVHSGSVVAGIVGVKKFAYDIWGDTVNTAARMEQNSEGGKINISYTTYDLVKGKFNCVYRGEIDAKNKGQLKMYFVDTAAAG